MIRVKVDAAGVIHKLERIKDAVTDLGDVLDQIGAGMMANIQLGIKEGKSPWGDPFAPLKELRSNNRDGRESDVPLNDTRQHIYNKINYKRVSDGVEVGMFEEQKIGITHQYGSEKKNITARPFLPLDKSGNVNLPDSWVREIKDVIVKSLKT